MFDRVEMADARQRCYGKHHREEQNRLILSHDRILHYIPSSGMALAPTASLGDLTHATGLAPSTSAQVPPELDQILTHFSSNRTVLGYVVLSRSQPVSIIRQSGAIFEGEQGRKYASVIGRMVESAQTGLDEVAGVNGSDSVRIDILSLKKVGDSNYFTAGCHQVYENKNKTP